MIHTEKEYQRAIKQVEATEKGTANQRAELLKKDMSADQIKRLLDPGLSLLEDMKDEIQWYERAKKGIFYPVTDLESLGRTLVALRISSGLTQEELASKLGVTQPQVSRDENEEYHAITVERAQKILAVFGARLESKVIMTPPHHGETPLGSRKAA